MLYQQWETIKGQSEKFLLGPQWVLDRHISQTPPPVPTKD